MTFFQGPIAVEIATFATMKNTESVKYHLVEAEEVSHSNTSNDFARSSKQFRKGRCSNPFCLMPNGFTQAKPIGSSTILSLAHRHITQKTSTALNMSSGLIEATSEVVVQKRTRKLASNKGGAWTILTIKTSMSSTLLTEPIKTAFSYRILMLESQLNGPNNKCKSSSIRTHSVSDIISM